MTHFDAMTHWMRQAPVQYSTVCRASTSKSFHISPFDSQPQAESRGDERRAASRSQTEKIRIVEINEKRMEQGRTLSVN